MINRWFLFRLLGVAIGILLLAWGISIRLGIGDTVLVESPAAWQSSIPVDANGTVRLPSLTWRVIKPLPSSTYTVWLSTRTPVQIHIDLMAPGYDDGAQEVVFPPSAKHAIRAFQTGPKVPAQVELRVFSQLSTPELVIDQLRIAVRSGTANGVSWLLAGLGVLSIALVALTPSGRFRMLAGFFLVILVLVGLGTGHQNLAGTGDNMWNVPGAQAILYQRTLDLSAWQEQIVTVQSYGIRLGATGNPYNYFPPGTSCLLLPFVAVQNILGFDDQTVAVWASRVMTALTATLFLGLLLEVGTGLMTATICASVFTLATSHLSIHGLSIWSSSTMLACLTAAWWAALAARGPLLALAAGLLVGFAFVCRPDGALIGPVALLFLILGNRWRIAPLVGFALGCGLVLVFFITWSWTAFGTIFPPYYGGNRIDPSVFPQAILGQWFSPNRGFFIFNPVMLAAIPGAVVGIVYDRDRRWLWIGVTAHVVVGTILIACFPHWWGGWSFGPRLQAPLYVSIALLCVPFIIKILKCHSAWQKPVLLFIGLLVAAGAVVHWRAVRSFGPHEWNSTPVSVDSRPDRIWDWSDWQPIRRVYGQD